MLSAPMGEFAARLGLLAAFQHELATELQAMPLGVKRYDLPSPLDCY
jgi:hypothetical protein